MDDEYLEDLKAELIKAEGVAVDENGEVSVWKDSLASSVQRPEAERVQGPRSKVEEEAEECFLKAIEISRKQQAKSLELRTATSLARLWQQQGKSAEAHKLLSEVYNWFTEGFDTKDLLEAKILVEELS